MADAQPNAFEEKIEAMIDQLGSKRASKRREAAYFLGEVAAADAVPALVDVYEKDKDARVRAAAAYSLGMYKAVDRALKAGEEAQVVALLTRIEEDGKMGGRARVGRTIKIILALAISLIVLIAIFVARDSVKGMLFGSTKPHTQVIAEVQQSFTLIKNDTRTLQSALLDVISNRPLNCIAYFSNPPPYALDPVDAHTFPDAADMVTQLNTAQASLASAKTHYDAACNQGATFGATEAQQTFQILLPALQILDPLEVKLTQAEAVQPTAIPSVPPTAAPTIPVAQATAAPATQAATQGAPLQPTIPPDVLAQGKPKSHLPALFNIIDTVTDTRGASTLLIQYWEDVQKTGSTTGCSALPPEIPDNNVFIPEIDYQASPDLREAVQLLNSGLAALHTGWTNFQFACNSRNLAQTVVSELPTAHVVAAAFQAADVKLQAVQNAP